MITYIFIIKMPGYRKRYSKKPTYRRRYRKRYTRRRPLRSLIRSTVMNMSEQKSHCSKIDYVPMVNQVEYEPLSAVSVGTGIDNRIGKRINVNYISGRLWLDNAPNTTGICMMRVIIVISKYTTVPSNAAALIDTSLTGDVATALYNRELPQFYKIIYDRTHRLHQKDVDAAAEYSKIVKFYYRFKRPHTVMWDDDDNRGDGHIWLWMGNDNATKPNVTGDMKIGYKDI